MKRKSNLLKAVVASVVVLIITYTYWNTQPDLEVSTLPVASAISYPGAYVKAKLPEVHLEHYQ